MFVFVALSGCAKTRVSPYDSLFGGERYELRKSIENDEYNQTKLLDIAINREDDVPHYALRKLTSQDLIATAAVNAKRISIRKEAILELNDVKVLDKIESMQTDKKVQSCIKMRREELENNLRLLDYHLVNEVKIDYEMYYGVVVDNKRTQSYTDYLKERSKECYEYNIPKHYNRVMVLPNVQHVATVRLGGEHSIIQNTRDDQEMARAVE